MRRKPVLMALGILLLAAGLLAAVLALLLWHEPSCYARAAVEPGLARRPHACACQSEFARLISDLINREPHWQATFTEAQVNSFFEENFLTDGWAGKLLPEGISAPRLLLEEGRVRLAFRYGSGLWSTVVTV